MAHSKIAVYAALAGNGAVMIAKFAAAAITGSSALIAESLHSIADTSDSALLLYGEYRSKRPPDDLHPFGHGRELYFWSMVVALMIFMIGGAASVVEGISRVRHPGELESPTASYVVLGVSLLFETTTGIIAFRQFRKGMRDGEGYWEAYTTAKDPTTFMVLFEDTAAVLGLILAFLGVFLSHRLQKPWLDGAASIAIGLLLMTIAVFLCREVQKLLIGERVDDELHDALTKAARETENVAQVIELKTMHRAPEDVIAIFTLRFRDGVAAQQAEQAAGQLTSTIRERHPEVKQVYVALRG